MLTVNNLTKRYGDVLANSKVTFTAEDGQITLMVGPNGAGKSTAIKCIAGLLRFQGEVLIGPYRNKTLEAKRIFGYIPELPVMYDSLTVYEHLEFIGRAYGVKDWKQRADQLLERMELSDKVKKLGKELSKGMQQKVSICCALLPRPQVVLFDEPCGAGSSRHQGIEADDAGNEAPGLRRGDQHPYAGQRGGALGQDPDHDEGPDCGLPHQTGN